ncbi:MAG: sulfotransferase [Burkholderiales bacterium]|nr:sulfotransferase [Burkholderiales bacterium]
MHEAAAAGIERPVFIVGTFRSGTTLLAELLGQSPSLCHCRFELKDLWSAAGGVRMASPKTRDLVCPECTAADYRPASAAALAAAFRTRMEACEGGAGGRVLLNKNPHLCNKLPLVDAMFPDGRFIWIHRDLPQVVASIRRLFADIERRQRTRHWWPLPAAGVRNRCWNAVHDDAAAREVEPARLFPGGDVIHIAEYWLETNRAVAEYVARLPSCRHVELAEEDLLDDAARELDRIAGHLQLIRPTWDLASAAIDPARNRSWRDDLTGAEIAALADFVARRGSEIADIFRRCRGAPRGQAMQGAGA